MGTLPMSLQHLQDPEVIIAFIPQLRGIELPENVLQPAIDAYLVSMKGIVYAITGFASLGLLSSFLIRELTLEIDEIGQEQFEK